MAGVRGSMTLIAKDGDLDDGICADVVLQSYSPEHWLRR